MRLQKLLFAYYQRVAMEFRSWCWEFHSKYHRVVTVSTKQGRLTVLTGRGEPIGRFLYCNREYEYDFMSKAMELLRSLHMLPVKGQGTIVDIGANNGVISISMLHARELEKAVAIEPEPRNFALLEHNVRQNGLNDKFICLPYAVSDRTGQIAFELCDTNCGDHRVRTGARTDTVGELFDESKRSTINVRCARLDDLLTRVPDFSMRDVTLVWIDVQGYEGYAFMGAGELLSQKIPVVAEIWPYGIKRAGMSLEQFCHIAKDIWKHYWVMRNGHFVRRSIDDLALLLDKLGSNGNFANVIFTY